MDQDKIKKIENCISNLKSKSNKFYFFVLDTKGYAKASIRYIYQIALTLKDKGYHPVILHEKSDYTGVSEWMGEKYMEIDHQSIESQTLNVSPEDFIFIPEIFGHVIEQVSKLPCAKIVISQSYDHIFETLKPGNTWTDYKFFKCITTTNEQKEYINSIMKNVSIDVIEPVISEEFDEKKLPCKPIVSIHTRNQRDTMVIIKTFYIKYPQYRWITFRDMRGVNTETFAEYLKDSFVSVWIDDESSFGTFPLESMASGTPVIGKVPTIKPKWMNDDNGIWFFDKIQTIDIIAEFIQNWLEDNISEKLYEEGLKTSSEYMDQSVFEDKVVDLIESYVTNRIESLESQLEIKELQES